MSGRPMILSPGWPDSRGSKNRHARPVFAKCPGAAVAGAGFCPFVASRRRFPYDEGGAASFVNCCFERYLHVHKTSVVIMDQANMQLVWSVGAYGLGLPGARLREFLQHSLRAGAAPFAFVAASPAVVSERIRQRLMSQPLRPGIGVRPARGSEHIDGIDGRYRRVPGPRW